MPKVICCFFMDTSTFPCWHQQVQADINMYILTSIAHADTNSCMLTSTYPCWHQQLHADINSFMLTSTTPWWHQHLHADINSWVLTLCSLAAYIFWIELYSAVSSLYWILFTTETDSSCRERWPPAGGSLGWCYQPGTSAAWE